AAQVPVVFLEADGSLTKETLTDAQGKASARVKAGASVTAVHTVSPTDHRVETILEVKPGDDLVMGSGSPEAAAGTFTVSFLDGPGTTTAYVAYGPCGGGRYTIPQGAVPGGALPSVQLVMTSRCKLSSMDLVLIREDGGQPTDYAALPSVAFSDGGSKTQ